MSSESEPLTDIDADLETLSEMLQHYDAFSMLDLGRVLKQFETGEDDEI
jgi:hypothetical protein